MANEIGVSASLLVLKGNHQDGLDASGLSFNFTGTRALHNVQNVGTSAEALVLGEIAAGGWCLMRNLDVSNYVQVRGASGQTPLARLGPGEVALFRLDATATAPTVQANTAACDLEYLVLEA